MSNAGAGDNGIEAELGVHYLLSENPELMVYNPFQSNSAGALASVVLKTSSAEVAIL